uniref:Uncharacterized protein n=1 Tax=Spongospora subterranea TaxID=70186 RepID=A0A0H5RPA8_9EUKA|eukprot:CRZ10554.1 hypothetical protein [Spongospora subterranea]
MTSQALCRVKHLLQTRVSQGQDCGSTNRNPNSSQISDFGSQHVQAEFMIDISSPCLQAHIKPKHPNEEHFSLAASKSSSWPIHEHQDLVDDDIKTDAAPSDTTHGPPNLTPTLDANQKSDPALIHDANREIRSLKSSLQNIEDSITAALDKYAFLTDRPEESQCGSSIQYLKMAVKMGTSRSTSHRLDNEVAQNAEQALRRLLVQWGATAEIMIHSNRRHKNVVDELVLNYEKKLEHERELWTHRLNVQEAEHNQNLQHVRDACEKELTAVRDKEHNLEKALHGVSKLLDDSEQMSSQLKSLAAALNDNQKSFIDNLQRVSEEIHLNHEAGLRKLKHGMGTELEEAITRFTNIVGNIAHQFYGETTEPPPTSQLRCLRVSSDDDEELSLVGSRPEARPLPLLSLYEYK